MTSDEKRCPQCGETLPASAFHRNRRRADGLQAQCRACTAMLRAGWYRRNGKTQQARTKRYKARNLRHPWADLEAHPCVDCGETDPVVFEFDHVRGEKVAALSNMAQRSYSLATLDAEIAKCEVRCANGHKRKTAREQGRHAALRATVRD